MSRIKGAIAITVMALSLSGCGQYKALPNEQRYQFINEAKNELDYSSAGKVTSEMYDKGDGVFSPSVFRVEINGENTYTQLKNRIKAISDEKCPESKTQINCKKGQVDIYLNQDETITSKVVLRLTDAYSGRTSK